MSALEADESERLLAEEPRRASAKTVTAIVKRIRAMTHELLPIQCDPDDLRSPTSSIITKEVVQAYSKCAGDFSDAVPYALLEARRLFTKDARNEPSDFDEHSCRTLACEVLARKIVASLPIERQYLVVSTRYQRIESDGDESLPLSAIESAVDQRAVFFLSSSESQRIIRELWAGHLVQVIDEHDCVSYRPYENAGKAGILLHLDPGRLAVPRYQNLFKQLLWIVFLLAYGFALQTPDRQFGVEGAFDLLGRALTRTDIVLYVQALGYLLEDLTRIFKIYSIAAFSLWTIVNLMTETLLVAAFSFRVADLSSHRPDQESKYRYASFQILACAAPLIWMKVLTMFDTFAFFGVINVVVARMMKESAIFFALLALLAFGFVQALTGLDVADSTRDSTGTTARFLFESLLGTAGFDDYVGENAIGYPAGLILAYSWTFLSAVILLNILIALFGSAYSDVTDSATDQHLAFFAGKVIGMIRAPDQFVYVAPFNLLEVLIVPFEFVLSRATYARLNAGLMRVIFGPVLLLIAVFEAKFEARKVRWERHRLLETDENDVDDLVKDPKADPADEGELSKLSFDDLVKAFPDLTASASTTILKELRSLRTEIDALRKIKTEQ